MKKSLVALAVALIAIPIVVFAGDTITQSYKNYNQASTSSKGTRNGTAGAQLGSWDPAVSGSLDTGYVDTAGCTAGCMSMLIEVETATTTSGDCTVYGGGSYDNSVTTDDFAVTIGTTQVAASSASLAASVCPGVSPATTATSAGVGFGWSAPLPKHVRVYCAAVAGVNLKAAMQCH